MNRSCSTESKQSEQIVHQYEQIVQQYEQIVHHKKQTGLDEEVQEAFGLARRSLSVGGKGVTLVQAPAIARKTRDHSPQDTRPQPARHKTIARKTRDHSPQDTRPNPARHETTARKTRDHSPQDTRPQPAQQMTISRNTETKSRKTRDHSPQDTRPNPARHETIARKTRDQIPQDTRPQPARHETIARKTRDHSPACRLSGASRKTIRVKSTYGGLKERGMETSDIDKAGLIFHTQSDSKQQMGQLGIAKEGSPFPPHLNPNSSSELAYQVYQIPSLKTSLADQVMIKYRGLCSKTKIQEL
ncbi:hypothetical protein EGW08_020514 [Elysia chlorotica]|uniref:Uncharacterized protein n=1 Tax=Elysia chlorotica TaxID=188477 RepID=A0A433SR61_ELYCH|nr:hypothetical protein EGW08_020514 [Elysia chlorotica]